MALRAWARLGLFRALSLSLHITSDLSTPLLQHGLPTIKNSWSLLVYLPNSLLSQPPQRLSLGILVCNHHELEHIRWISLLLHVPLHHHFHLSLPEVLSHSGAPVKHFTSMVSTSLCGGTGDLHVHLSFSHMMHSMGSISFSGIISSDGLSIS
jgi:hypothetical protein